MGSFSFFAGSLGDYASSLAWCAAHGDRTAILVALGTGFFIGALFNHLCSVVDRIINAIER
jgi:hypothetical protein